MNELLTGLRAAGEPTRLRLLALCAHGELSVSELVSIVGQSQPRVSRHLKLLVEAQLLERFREGTQVFFRLAERGDSAYLARTLVDLIPTDDPEINRDLVRLEVVRQRRAAVAEDYFQRVAPEWDEIRALHVPERELEGRLVDLVSEQPSASYLDIGTGTGRVLSLLAGKVDRGIGVDLSREMLNVARTNLEKQRLRNVHVRHADMYNLPFDDGEFDLVTLHLVLHYARDPAGTIGEVARVLQPGGRLFIIDFAEHQQQQLCEQYRHVHAGFSNQFIAQASKENGLRFHDEYRFDGGPLTTVIWVVIKEAR